MFDQNHKDNHKNSMAGQGVLVNCDRGDEVVEFNGEDQQRWIIQIVCRCKCMRCNPLGPALGRMQVVAVENGGKAFYVRLASACGVTQVVIYAYTGTWLADFPMNHYTHWVGLLLQPSSQEVTIAL